MNPTIESLRQELRRKIDAVPELANYGVLDLAIPSIRLTTKRVPQEELKLGESRIGGLPDVPPDFQWPRWTPPSTVTDRYGDPFEPGRSSPLGFIAQFDLSDLPSIDEAIPRTGWLCFFYDRMFETWGNTPDDRGSCRVVYFDIERGLLERGRLPVDADSEQESNPCAVEVDVELTLPDHMDGCEYGEPRFEAYQELKSQLHERRGLTNHHLLGHPQPVQWDDWPANSRLLLQIDSDEEDPGWMWGDVGRIYFWIKKPDLANRCFDDVWLILQCC